MMFGRDDKRDFIRMVIDSEMSFSRINSNQSHSGKTLDISASGMRFSTTHPVDIGELLSVTITPKSDITPPLERTVEVVRVDRNKEEGSDHIIAGIMKKES